EAAHDHALTVEGHVLAHFFHARVAHELLVRGVAGLPRGIFEESEDDLLVRLCIDRLAEIGDLAFGNVAVPGFDVTPDAGFGGEGRKAARMLAIGVLVRLGHGRDESFKIGHAAAPSGSGWGWLSA